MIQAGSSMLSEQRLPLLRGSNFASDSGRQRFWWACPARRVMRPYWLKLPVFGQVCHRTLASLLRTFYDEGLRPPRE